jgi:hypothetical protein
VRVGWHGAGCSICKGKPMAGDQQTSIGSFEQSWMLQRHCHSNEAAVSAPCNAAASQHPDAPQLLHSCALQEATQPHTGHTHPGCTMAGMQQHRTANGSKRNTVNRTSGTRVDCAEPLMRMHTPARVPSCSSIPPTSYISERTTATTPLTASRTQGGRAHSPTESPTAKAPATNALPRASAVALSSAVSSASALASAIVTATPITDHNGTGGLAGMCLMLSGMAHCCQRGSALGL